MDEKLEPGDILEIEDRNGRRKMRAVLLAEGDLGLQVAPLVPEDDPTVAEQLVPETGETIQIWNHLLISRLQASRQGRLDRRQTQMMLRTYKSLYSMTAATATEEPPEKMSDAKADRQQAWAETVRSFWHPDHVSDA